MSNFTNIFGGGQINPAQPQYEALSISANTSLVWSLESAGGSPYVANQIDVTATAGALLLMMPPANQGSTGVAAIITNVGSNTFTVTDASGDVIQSIAASVSYIITLTNNSTNNGIWRSYQLGATTSNANAGALAGAGLTAVGSLLNVTIDTQTINANTNLTPGYQAFGVVWDGAVGTLQLEASATLGTGWWCLLTNQGTGALTLSTTGGDTINGVSSLVFPEGANGQFYSAIIVCTAGAFYAYSVPIVIPITGGGTGATTANGALTNLGGSSIGITIFTAPTAAAVLAALGISTSVFTENTISTNQVLSAGSSGTVYVCTAPLTLTLPQSSTVTTSFFFAAFGQGGAVTVSPNALDSINGQGASVAYTIPQGMSVLFVTDAANPGNWWPILGGGASGAGGILWANAGGTANAITATYAPAIIALTDGLLLGVRAASATASTAPTFSPNGLTAHPITKWGGAPLYPNDILAANAEAILRYNLAFTRWELLNPAFSAADFTNSTAIASATTTDLGTGPGNFALVTGTTTITSFGASANLNAPVYLVSFTGSLTLTNGASLRLPTGANIQTQANDSLIAEYAGGGVWFVLFYSRATGNPLSGTTGVTASIASATTTDLGTAASNVVTISGTTTITSFGSSALTTNQIYFLTFSGALLLTYNAASLILPGAQNITTAAGDTAVVQYLGSGNWRCRQYTQAAVAPTASGILQSGTVSGVSEASIDFNAAVLACSVLNIAFWNISPASAAANLLARVRVSGSDITTGYFWATIQGNNSGTSGAGANSTTSIQLGGSLVVGSTASAGVNMTIAANNTVGPFISWDAGIFVSAVQVAVRGNGTVGGLGGNATGISLYMSSGNIGLQYQITGH